jgi:hypothetical protein
MNKFLLASTVLLALLSGYLTYRLLSPPPTLVNTPPPKTCASLPYDYSNGDSVGIINYETAQLLAKNYNDTKRGIVAYNIKEKAYQPGEDSRNIWFSLDRLKNFIWHIENQNCKNGCTDSLGLRIYFGRYPSLDRYEATTEKGLDSVPKEYSNRLTLFMVPTYKDKPDNFYHDFYPPGKECRTSFANSPSQINGELVSHDITPQIFLFDVSGGTKESQNHGGLIPPGNPTGSSFNQ